MHSIGHNGGPPLNSLAGEIASLRIIQLQAEIERLEKTGRQAAFALTEQVRRSLGLARPGTTRWRRQDQAWKAQHTAVAEAIEIEKRRPQIERLRRKIARLQPLCS
jgi:hypothetical protein